jgi:hypothetical protein
MGLDKKTEGNPAFKEQAPGKSLNPGGRPKGSLSRKTHPQVKERLLGKWQTHPVDKLVEIANRVSASDPKMAAEIWTNLLKYFEPTKKPVETVPVQNTPEESVAAAQETFRLLEEIEKHGLSGDTEGSQGTGVETRAADVHAQASPKEDLPEHQGQ